MPSPYDKVRSEKGYTGYHFQGIHAYPSLIKFMDDKMIFVLTYFSRTDYNKIILNNNEETICYRYFQCYIYDGLFVIELKYDIIKRIDFAFDSEYSYNPYSIHFFTEDGVHIILYLGIYSQQLFSNE
jgi:hypothetical protein